ncbi:N-acetyltransferase [Nocardioides baekrokdamisoli]|uniref:N-acetyltransferase n=1 Tax=Nocardioides baekrokdamisoli TaxID=1804624 RepID=A0A3G9IMC1_9ACTN|nr:GNAT family N-acetyltransferase [Nocardioides baekrokdamisoli]BBH17155.1 N-acetyltransferase [Nocardioides baekrokdamisoli]
MSNDYTIRTATTDDAAACAAIYAPYVRETAITFETDPPSVEEMARRIAAANEQHVWLVMEVDGEIVGYAYGGKFAQRAAYRWATEGSVYLDMNRRGAGRGRALYAALIERLRDRGYRRFVGVVALPNEPSMRLHRAFGFAEMGVMRNIGWKHDAWHDVAYLGLNLTPGEDLTIAPPEVS